MIDPIATAGAGSTSYCLSIQIAGLGVLRQLYARIALLTLQVARE